MVIIPRQNEQAEFEKCLLAECPWTAASKLRIQRDDYRVGETLDPGVNFFLLALWSMGLRTAYSCEGHPSGFYITFYAKASTARLIHDAGFFSVEIESGKDQWSLRMDRNRTQVKKERALRWAAESWAKKLPLLKSDRDMFQAAA